MIATYVSIFCGADCWTPLPEVDDRGSRPLYCSVEHGRAAARQTPDLDVIASACLIAPTAPTAEGVGLW